jgi:hypothetical protein
VVPDEAGLNKAHKKLDKLAVTALNNRFTFTGIYQLKRENVST